MEGKIEVSRHRGKQRRTWTSDVTDWCGLSYKKCVRMEKIEKNGVPWQPTFFFEDGTHSDGE